MPDPVLDPMRLLLCFATWLAAALAVGGLLGGLHRPRDPRVDADFAAFLAQKDEVDVLFLGSSRIYRGVVPEVFDTRLAKRGHELRSFNLGMRGMLPHEVNELLRRVLDARPARLSWVLIELADWPPRRQNYYTSRAIGWHDLPETLSAIGTRWREDQPLLTRLDDVRIQLLQFGARASALGLPAEGVRDWFDRLTDPDDASAPEEDVIDERARYEGYLELSLAHRGHAPFSNQERAEGSTAEHRREFLNKRYEYLAHVERLPELNAAEVSLEHFNLPALEAQIEDVTARGLQLAYVIPPSFEEVPLLHQLDREGHLPRLLAFDDPRAHPELFEVDNRFDLRHLDKRGARLFTRALADRVADFLDAADR